MAVMLPGTGSDEVFVRSVFEIPLAAVGVRAQTPCPQPGPGLADAFLAALDLAALVDAAAGAGLSPRTIVELLRAAGVPRREAYRAAQSSAAVSED